MGVADGLGLRAHKQPSATSLKTVRYEESQAGRPPHKVTKLAGSNTGATPPTISASDTTSPSIPSSPRPGTAPTPPCRQHRDEQHQAIIAASQRSSQVKRDSGIAASFSTTASNHSLPSAGGAARQPDLPTIVVQDDGHSTAAAIPEVEDDRSRSPVARTVDSFPVAHRPRIVSKSSSPPPKRRTMSYSGLDDGGSATEAADDINLGDLTSDKITFSTRGSLLFGGKRMQELIASKGDDVDKARSSGVTSTIPGSVIEPQQEKAVHKEETRTDHTPTHDTKSEAPKQGLIAGRRKPSTQMLQAAYQNGRVLSAEEVTFSSKVRSMYDHGDERAANWYTPMAGAVSGKSTPDLSGRNTATPDTLNGDLSVQKNRLPASRKSSISADPRSSFYSKEANEIAGGIEDWDNVDSRQVDRYGFIHFDRSESRLSNSSPSPQQPAAGMQRVATSLRVEAAQPRRDRKSKRGPSSIRSSSVPPESRNGTNKKYPASMHSTNSTSSTSRSNLFRSRARKALIEAPDMLTLPPGLANIAEDEDAGATASSQKQREWSREQKWQKMAMPVKLKTTAGKGGGMRFDFDVNDPKLVERTWKGIPDRWRATAWHSFLSASAKKRNSPATDEELIGQFYKLQGISSADDVQIDVDVPRTINMHVMFRKRYRGGQRLLFRVLHAVSLYFPETGYVQGMAALAVTLLCYYEEELAFVMMVRLWQLRGLDNLFESGFEGLMTCLKEFEAEWLRGGDVAVKLKDLGIDSTAWGTRWYLTLFNMSVPFPAQLRIWDVFMLLGDASSANSGAFSGADLDVLHSISAALIDATREILLDSDFENAMKVLTSFVPIKDEDLLMRVAKAEYKMKKKRDGVKV